MPLLTKISPQRAHPRLSMVTHCPECMLPNSLGASKVLLCCQTYNHLYILLWRTKPQPTTLTIQVVSTVGVISPCLRSHLKASGFQNSNFAKTCGLDRGPTPATAQHLFPYFMKSPKRLILLLLPIYMGEKWRIRDTE